MHAKLEGLNPQGFRRSRFRIHLQFWTRSSRHPGSVPTTSDHSFPRTPPCSQHSSRISRTFLLSLKYTQHTPIFEHWHVQVPLPGRFFPDSLRGLFPHFLRFLLRCHLLRDTSSPLSSPSSPLAVKTVVPNQPLSVCLSGSFPLSFLYPALPCFVFLQRTFYFQVYCMQFYWFCAFSSPNYYRQ